MLLLRPTALEQDFKDYYKDYSIKDCGKGILMTLS